MAFPTAAISTTNVETSTADPSLARADINSAFTALNSIITEANAAGGVLVLDASGKVSATAMPNNINTSGSLSLSPATGRVEINDILNLTPLTTAQVSALSSSTGDVAYVSDGDTGSPCIAVYDGTDWKTLSLGTTISAT